MRRHSALNNGTATIQNLVNHFENIPIEIFTEIVKMVLQLETHSSPLLISHVSRKWREVVHNNPSMWDSLVLAHRRPKAKAQFWMARTQGKLKGLTIRRHAATKAKMKSWEPILKQVKWESLHVLRVQRWPVVDYLSRIGKVNALVSLEVLELDRDNSFNSFRSIQSSLDSSLRHLTILSQRPLLVYTPLQARNLTTLTLTEVSVQGGHFYDLLSANPLLVHLSLENTCHNGIYKNITMHHLKSLRLSNYVHIPIDGLKMPALEAFQVERFNTTMRMINFLRRFASGYSSVQLTVLIFSSCRDYFDFQDISPLLLASPNLKNLEVTGTPSPGVTSVIEFLSAPYHSGITQADLASSFLVCPHLTYVNFSGCLGAQTGPIMRLVKSRLTVIDNYGNKFGWDGQRPAPQAEPILSMIIDFCPQIDPSWVLWLRYRVPRVSYVLAGNNSASYDDQRQSLDLPWQQ